MAFLTHIRLGRLPEDQLQDLQSAVVPSVVKIVIHLDQQLFAYSYQTVNFGYSLFAIQHRTSGAPAEFASRHHLAESAIRGSKILPYRGVIPPSSGTQPKICPSLFHDGLACQAGNSFPPSSGSLLPE
jgi:hypothetical protein